MEGTGSAHPAISDILRRDPTGRSDLAASLLKLGFEGCKKGSAPDPSPNVNGDEDETRGDGDDGYVHDPDYDDYARYYDDQHVDDDDDNDDESVCEDYSGSEDFDEHDNEEREYYHDRDPATETEATGGGPLSESCAQVLTVMSTVNEPVPPGRSVLRGLDGKIRDFFANRPEHAFYVFSMVHQGVQQGTYKIVGGRHGGDCKCGGEVKMLVPVEAALVRVDAVHVWDSCRLAATLVMLLAADSHPSRMYRALRWQSKAQKRPPSSAEEARREPSASLALAFGKAKKAALGPEGKTTVIGVTLVDVHSFDTIRTPAPARVRAEAGMDPLDLLEKEYYQALRRNMKGIPTAAGIVGKPEMPPPPSLPTNADKYFSFSHAFVVGVGPEGFAVWQARGPYGYRLDGYLDGGGSEVRGWAEADQFVSDFEKLAGAKGPWNAKTNKLYRKLFHTDVTQLCGKNGPERPVTPKYKAWVRIHTIEGVSLTSVNKFSLYKEK
ncbi:hypothetical protein N3K66_006394 [Trichothecium roseum]|uniref:Uncharacterized protein n=1 Tax=Trichothecium roseum TaxID=47278 RepID=A0ACC0UVB9_9HYPO|nr:hypothetical protein N3K66_006394 [Trichothecium roseum]